MDLILLSGNSLRNKQWIYEAENELKPLFGKTYVQDYKHWETGAENIDLTLELEVLKHQIPKLGKYGVFTKSIGIVLAVKAIEQGIINPAFMLFCGIPLGYILADYPQFASVIATKHIPITIIHNDNDPVGSSAEVKVYLNSVLANHPNFKFIETKGTAHDYEDYNLLRTELKELLN